MRANQAKQPWGRPLLGGQARPAIPHLDAVLALAGAFALQTKDLPDLTPVTIEIVVEIRTRHDPPTFQTPMSFLPLLKGLPRASIRLRVFKKEFQVGTRGRRVVFDEENHVASCSLNQASERMVTLSGIGCENAPFAQHRGQQGFECTHLVAFLPNGTLL